MLIELDQFIQFIIDYRSDDRIRIFKRMKYGFRHYHIIFIIDVEPDDKNSKNTYLSRFNGGSIEITFDNRNGCIDLINHSTDDHIVIEDSEMLDKWNEKLEEIVNEGIGEKVTQIMEDALASCYKKDLYRIYKMKYLFGDDDSDTKTDLDI